MVQTNGRDIKQAALDHYMFPLARADDIRDEGMMLFTRGEGARMSTARTTWT